MPELELLVVERAADNIIIIPDPINTIDHAGMFSKGGFNSVISKHEGTCIHAGHGYSATVGGLLRYSPYTAPNCNGLGCDRFMHLPSVPHNQCVIVAACKHDMFVGGVRMNNGVQSCTKALLSGCECAI